MRGRGAGPGVAVVVLAALVVLVGGGCGFGAAKDAVQQRNDPEPTADEVLEGLVYDAGDVLPNEDPIDLGRIRPLLEPTLDLCDGDFPSEQHRLDRRSRTLFPKTADGTPVLDDPTTITATRYEPGHAQKALDQLAMAAATCDPERYVDEGTPDAHRTEIDPEDPALGAELTPGAFARSYSFIQRSTMGGEQALAELIVVQRRGDVLVVVDGEPVRTKVLAETVAERLAALEPAAVGE